ncbi:YwpF-like family protein [Rossellomorea marisflavi]|uniref:YwpF-like family protein n=1 Tax=Rossellomorea marisflavi TaxID=189381 RepID=UPI0027A732B2|nr:YwpF-like family protein [Rossellomorea marisflavi]UTE73329.1 YwpF-like family protein [Rossellomorea marisflavi]
MKTFKVVSLQVVQNDELVDFNIVDGLIINKEDGKKTWLVETLLTNDHIEFFQEAQQKSEDLEIQVVISHKGNDPAAFMTSIRCIKELGANISIMFEGKLKKQKNEYAELLLDDLIQKGMSGEELLQAFRDKMVEKPRIPASSKAGTS